MLYSKLGHQHCPGCDRKLSAQSRSAITDQIRRRYPRGTATVLAPKVFGRKGFHKDVLARALKKGFTKARIDGSLTPLKEGLALSRYHEHNIDLVIGSLPAADLDALVDHALQEGNGCLATGAPSSATRSAPMGAIFCTPN